MQALAGSRAVGEQHSGATAAPAAVGAIPALRERRQTQGPELLGLVGTVASRGALEAAVLQAASRIGRRAPVPDRL